MEKNYIIKEEDIMKYNCTFGIGATFGTALVVAIIANSIVKASANKQEAKVEIARAEAEKARYLNEAKNNKG